MTNKTTSIQIQHEKKHLHLTPANLYMYQGFQVIEAYHQEHAECYYLFFYKASYLTGKSTSKIKRKSQLSNILQKGIRFSPEHPLLAYLLNHNRIHTFPSLTPLWERIQKKYSPLEASNILTIFDNYMKKEKITKVMKEFALQYRREGQLLHTYQLLRLITDIYPANKWAQEMSKNLQYQTYQSLYTSHPSTLLSKDPLYVEKYCYEHLEHDDSKDLLLQLMQKEGRKMEQFSLYTHLLITSKNDEHTCYKQMIANLPHDFTTDEKVDLLSYILRKRATHHEGLYHDLLGLLKKSNRYEDLLILLTKNKALITEKDLPYVQEALLQVKWIENSDWLSELTFHFDEDVTTKQVQILFQTFVPNLLQIKGLDYTEQWIAPYCARYPGIPILMKIKKMAALKDDPDQMYALGELYYEFKQLSEAVECFNWELELDPSNTGSIKWLSKLYLEMGMVEESKSYQYMLRDGS
ncbi:hypothetical protein ACQCU1_00825 [Sutcliffiella horikoshii]|uniref:Tetratricopeptide repeat protein n=1 Tax=Sutcliffiella horikoshii TaxID=79883 RepID=A0AA94WS26_9BACI|nr:hypothetical protein [Sutcliffiella horikoshii]TYS59709.1 hypothetical protein FZC74_06030 [Sutcliffiella horikoshii]